MKSNSNSPNVRRLTSLTGLRFVAAFGVFGFHFAPYLRGTAHSVIGAIFDQGSSGVGFFFILSGVVLTWSRRTADTPWTFYRRRFARIYPNYLTAWILTIGVIAYEGGVFYLHAGLLSLFLVQDWLPRTAIIEGWNGVSWTLSCEMFFYLLFPFLVRRIENMDRPLVLAPFLCLPSLVLGAIGTIWYSHTTPQILLWLLDFFPPVRLCEFVLGIIIAVALQRDSLPRLPLFMAGMLILAVYALVSWGPAHWLAKGVLIAPIALLIVASAQRDIENRPTVWTWGPLVLLGEWSYAFYLLHQLVLRVWAKAFHAHLRVSSLSAGGFWFVCLLLTSILAAAILFNVVERPLERRIRGAAPRVELDPSN
jgi:peptidoglycan/LPS O-acetylase OafA/YrhL